MGYFLEQVQLVVPFHGFDFLRPTPTPQTGDRDTDRSPLMVMNEIGVSACEIGGKFVFPKGSTARKAASPFWTSYVALRDSLIAQGKLVPLTDELYQFADDVAFQRPSGAAASRRRQSQRASLLETRNRPNLRPVERRPTRKRWQSRVPGEQASKSVSPLSAASSCRQVVNRAAVEIAGLVWGPVLLPQARTVPSICQRLVWTFTRSIQIAGNSVEALIATCRSGQS